MAAISFEKLEITKDEELTDKTFQKLLSWVRENSKGKQKLNWENVKLDRAILDNGDGVMVARSQIAKGLKLTLPPACVLTQDKVLSSTVGKLFSGLDIYTLFSLFILCEKYQRDSFWEPYIKVLPKDISFHPITFLDEEYHGRTEDENKTLIAELEKYKYLKRALVAQKTKLEGEWQRVQQLIKLLFRRNNICGYAVIFGNLFAYGFKFSKVLFIFRYIDKPLYDWQSKFFRRLRISCSCLFNQRYDSVAITPYRLMIYAIYP